MLRSSKSSMLLNFQGCHYLWRGLFHSSRNNYKERLHWRTHISVREMKHQIWGQRIETKGGREIVPFLRWLVSHLQLESQLLFLIDQPGAIKGNWVIRLLLTKYFTQVFMKETKKNTNKLGSTISSYTFILLWVQILN